MSTERIRVLANELSAALQVYFAIHTNTFNFSLRKLIPIKGIFKLPDYAGFETTLSQMGKNVAGTRREIAALDASWDGPESEHLVVQKLAAYAESVDETIGRLRDICGKLADKSAGRTAYEWKEYQGDVRVYKATVSEYMGRFQDFHRALKIVES